VAGYHRADDLPATHGITGGDRCDDRFEARDHPVAVSDRQHRTVDDDPGEVHDAIRGRVEGRARGANVYPPVPSGVGRRGGEVLPRDRARRIDRPAPGPGGSLDRGERGGVGRAQQEHDEGEGAEHPPIIRAFDTPTPEWLFICG